MQTAQEQKTEEGPNFKRSGSKKTETLKFSELDDLFLNDKGKKLRNLKKKLDKYLELQVQAKQGDIQPNAQQKEQIASIKDLRAQIKEL